jgi:hypothetical protein
MENKANNTPNNISIIWKKVYEANGRIMPPIIQSNSIKAFREFKNKKRKNKVQDIILCLHPSGILS